MEPYFGWNEFAATGPVYTVEAPLSKLFNDRGRTLRKFPQKTATGSSVYGSNP